MDLKVSRKEVLMLFVFVAACLLVGVLSGLTAPSMDKYADLNTPPLSPPGILFPIVWTVLYAFMGIALWMMWRTVNDYRYYVLFGIQLVLNFLWTPIYFAWGNMYLALVDLILIWIFVIIMAWLSYMHDVKPATYLMVPYILWLMFAAYLTIGTIVLN